MSPFISSERINGDEVLVVESQTNKGQTSESDMREYDANAKTDTMKSESKSELAASLVEKEGVQAKTRNQTGRARQTQSGPLVPGMVLSNSQSERARKFERFSASSYSCYVSALCSNGGLSKSLEIMGSMIGELLNC